MKYVISLGCAVVMLLGAAVAQEDQPGFRLSRGKIENLAESTMKVKDSTETNQYQATDGTKINIDGKSKLSDLKSGEEVTVVYQRQGEKNVITEINSLPLSSGKVTSNESGTLTMKDSSDKTWTFKLSDTCKVSMNDKSSKLNSLQAGDQCNICYSKQGETLTARYIECKRK